MPRSANLISLTMLVTHRSKSLDSQDCVFSSVEFARSLSHIKRLRSNRPRFSAPESALNLPYVITTLHRILIAVEHVAHHPSVPKVVAHLLVEAPPMLMASCWFAFRLSFWRLASRHFTHKGQCERIELLCEILAAGLPWRSDVV
jgi:hypothetical protein